MNETESNPRVASILSDIASTRAEPPADLWARIGKAHVTRVRRRRLRRIAIGGVLGVALVGAIVVTEPLLPKNVVNKNGTDWQARAQALELQLHTLESGSGKTATSADVAYRGDPAESELADIDGRLQTAYEHGGNNNELLPLWKRRSELLDTLIKARREGLTLTSI
jgi:hypothetical protein